VGGSNSGATASGIVEGTHSTKGKEVKGFRDSLSSLEGEDYFISPDNGKGEVETVLPEEIVEPNSPLKTSDKRISSGTNSTIEVDITDYDSLNKKRESFKNRLFNNFFFKY
jgi:hypothetical protein